MGQAATGDFARKPLTCRSELLPRRTARTLNSGVPPWRKRLGCRPTRRRQHHLMALADYHRRAALAAALKRYKNLKPVSLADWRIRPSEG